MTWVTAPRDFPRPSLPSSPPLLLPGAFPFFRLAALAAGVPVCFPFPISHFQEIENP
jgi:hypothetical protein